MVVAMQECNAGRSQWAHLTRGVVAVRSITFAVRTGVEGPAVDGGGGRTAIVGARYCAKDGIK